MQLFSGLVSVAIQLTKSWMEPSYQKRQVPGVILGTLCYLVHQHHHL